MEVVGRTIDLGCGTGLGSRCCSTSLPPSSPPLRHKAWRLLMAMTSSRRSLENSVVKPAVLCVSAQPRHPEACTDASSASMAMSANREDHQEKAAQGQSKSTSYRPFATSSHGSKPLRREPCQADPRSANETRILAIAALVRQCAPHPQLGLSGRGGHGSGRRCQRWQQHRCSGGPQRMHRAERGHTSTSRAGAPTPTK